jgi:hypothetical protein
MDGISFTSTAVSLCLRFSMAPRFGHFEAAKRILGYLKKYPEYRIRLYHNHLDMVKSVETFPEYNSWHEFYP